MPATLATPPGHPPSGGEEESLGSGLGEVSLGEGSGGGDESLGDGNGSTLGNGDSEGRGTLDGDAEGLVFVGVPGVPGATGVEPGALGASLPGEGLELAWLEASLPDCGEALATAPAATAAGWPAPPAGDVSGEVPVDPELAGAAPRGVSW